jgi:TonB family protein
VPRRADLITVGLAVVVHAALGLAVTRVAKTPRARPKAVLLQFAKRPETPPETPAPPAAVAAKLPAARPQATRKVAMRARPVAPASAAVHAAAPTTSPAPSPTPVYAVAMSSPNASGPPVAASGGAPGGTGHGSGPAPSAGTGDSYRPASARELGAMPEVDTDACGRAAVYPREAEQSGTEGDVRLRVALNERGQVHAVRVLAGLGRGLDAAAIDAIKNRCRFKPAIGRDGQPVAFVIESYTFHFELPR